MQGRRVNTEQYVHLDYSIYAICIYALWGRAYSRWLGGRLFTNFHLKNIYFFMDKGVSENLKCKRKRTQVYIKFIFIL